MKKIFATILLFLTVVLQSPAVLKEQNLNRTLHVLRLELFDKWDKQKDNMKRMHDRNEAQHANLINIMKRCETTSLILYSQGQDFTFDMAYACQEATTLYHELRLHTMPFDQIKNDLSIEIERYDSLIFALKRLPPAIGEAKTEEIAQLEQELGHHHAKDVDEIDQTKVDVHVEGLNVENSAIEQIHDFEDHGDGCEEGESELDHLHHTFMLDSLGIQDRLVCITYAQELRDNLQEVLESIEEDSQNYTEVTSQVAKLNDYAQKKYSQLQQNIFINPGSNYFKIISRLPVQWKRMQSDMRTKYEPLSEHEGEDVDMLDHKRQYKSEWRGPVVLFASIFMLIYLFVATILSIIILRLLLPAKYKTESFMKKRTVYTLLLATSIFAIAVMVARGFMNHNLMLMASGMMIEMAWLIAVILISIAIRLNADQAKWGVRLYLPFILMSVIVICFRIVLIPNTLVNIIFPPILLIFTVWQYISMRRWRKRVPTSDKVYCFISFLAMLAACCMSWVGYTLAAVQVMVWWMFQLAAIASITCCYDLMEMYENTVLERRIKRAYGDHLTDEEILRKMKRGDFVDKTWMYDFINRALVPVCAVFSVLFSIYMSAEIFDLRDLCVKWFIRIFSIPSIAKVSAFKLCFVVALYFVFKYLNYLTRAIWFSFRKKNNENFNETLAKNVIGMVIWFIYLVIVFLMLNVPGTGIAVVTGGLSTGMGFASKSLLENFFYGISLMSGRVRVGDYIECDGITGKVESISYQSTQLITLDGSVVAILNSELFNKNFKNLTRNHQYELMKIPFGVAYGSNVEDVRKMILEGVKPLCTKTDDGRDVVNPTNPIAVTFSDFGASSVDLFLVAWVLVDHRNAFSAQAKEIIYRVLNDNNIEIPFPQQDIYIRSIVKE